MFFSFTSVDWDWQLATCWQVVQVIQAGAMPGLREAYTQSMNVVIRKELRLYASSLRKAATASTAMEPDMGMAHKRVTLPAPFHPPLRVMSCNSFITT